MKQILLALFLMTVFGSVSVIAQENNSVLENQCRMYNKAGFVGTKIIYSASDADFRDLLKYITEQTGCDFVVDKSIGKIPISVRADNIPWNIVLNSILESQNLSVELNGSIFRAAETARLSEESKKIIIYDFSQPDNEPLITESVQLNHLPNCWNNYAVCDKSSNALNNLKNAINRRLSKCGKVEIDETTHNLIITDVEERTERIKRLVIWIDTQDLYDKIEEGKQEYSPTF